MSARTWLLPAEAAGERISGLADVRAHYERALDAVAAAGRVEADELRSVINSQAEALTAATIAQAEAAAEIVRLQAEASAQAEQAEAHAQGAAAWAAEARRFERSVNAAYAATAEAENQAGKLSEIIGGAIKILEDAAKAAGYFTWESPLAGSDRLTALASHVRGEVERLRSQGDHAIARAEALRRALSDVRETAVDALDE